MNDYGLSEIERGPVHVEKTPDEAVVLGFPWAVRLDGETISSKNFELPDGLTSESEAQDGTNTTIRVSGGEDCSLYRVIAKVTTSESRDLEWVKRVRVREG